MWWLVVACSGEGAMERIEAAERTGHHAAIAAAALVVIAAAVVVWRTRRMSRWFYALVPLAALHPGITCGARHGDCGSMVEMLAWPATGLVTALSVAAVTLAVRGARRQPR